MSQTPLDRDDLQRAAARIAEADGLLIGAGAGMGVDSGLPDFRGNQGFWKAYPPFAKRGLSFVDMANPSWFFHEPTLAWGFYGHRLHLYRDTVPHEGFSLLHKWGMARPEGLFVYTSNVDGQFQKAGYAEQQVLECHGSIHHMQCSLPCNEAIWPARDEHVDVDESTFYAQEPLPRCHTCKQLARPNILMFGDGIWHSWRSEAQRSRFEIWLDRLEGKKIVAVECGAGTAIPSVRWACSRATQGPGGTLIRINPREPQIRGSLGLQGISFAAGALEALRAIDALL